MYICVPSRIFIHQLNLSQVYFHPHSMDGEGNVFTHVCPFKVYPWFQVPDPFPRSLVLGPVQGTHGLWSQVSSLVTEFRSFPGRGRNGLPSFAVTGPVQSPV